MQSHEDRVNEAVMIMDTNSNVIAQIRAFYLGLVEQVGLPWVSECQDAISQFASQLDEMIYDLNMHISRAQVLVKISQDRKQLVRIFELYQIHCSVLTRALPLLIGSAENPSSKLPRNGRFDDSDATNHGRWPKRGSGRSNYNCCHTPLPPRNVCISELFMSQVNIPS